MPEYLDDPSVLTKERLKSELQAHRVELPGGNPTKDVYVQLYLKNLTAQNQLVPAATLDAFSSDEELPPPVVSGRGRSSGRKASRKSEELLGGQVDVALLTDEGLRGELRKLGVDVGPVVASTRKLYEKKLQKLLDQGSGVPPPLVLTELQVNGDSEPDLYSDKEDDATLEPEPEPEPEVEPEPEPVAPAGRTVRSRGKTPVTTRTRSSQHHQEPEERREARPVHHVEKITARDQAPAVEDDVLKLFSSDSSPTGISATCRRPIRGAAGRPVAPGDLWRDDKRLLSPPSSFSYTERPAARPPPPASFSPSPRPLATPPAAPAAPRPGSLWKKLALLALLAGFLFLVYQAMEADSLSPFLTTDQQGERSSL